MADLYQEIIRLPLHGRRELFGHGLVAHTHLFNSRLHRTIEKNRMIDGGKIIRHSGETIFHNLFQSALNHGKPLGLDDAFSIFSILGYGRLVEFSEKDHIVRVLPSHVVVSGTAAQPHDLHCAGAFIEGYLQAALRLHCGTGVSTNKLKCITKDNPCCEYQFFLDGHAAPLNPFEENSVGTVANPILFDDVFSQNFSRTDIVDRMFDLPLLGDSEGLIRNFNSLLVHFPADYYLLLSTQYLEQMSQLGLHDAALFLLCENAESSAIEAFHGFMNSIEWDTLIHPLIREPHDNLYALVAMMSALGWGNIHIQDHKPNTNLILKTANGHESSSFRKHHPLSVEMTCHMLAATASGLMGLVYGHGDLVDRFGLYLSREIKCICRGDDHCLVNCLPRTISPFS